MPKPVFEVIYCGPGGSMSPNPPDGYLASYIRILGTEVIELPGDLWAYEVQVRWDLE